MKYCSNKNVLYIVLETYNINNKTTKCKIINISLIQNNSSIKEFNRRFIRMFFLKYIRE